MVTKIKRANGVLRRDLSPGDYFCHSTLENSLVFQAIKKTSAINGSSNEMPSLNLEELTINWTGATCGVIPLKLVNVDEDGTFHFEVK